MSGGVKVDERDVGQYEEQVWYQGGEMHVRKNKSCHRVEACRGCLPPLPWQSAVVAQVWLPARGGGGAGGR